MSGPSRAICGAIAGLAAAVALSACGGGSRQDVQEPSGNYTVAITSATFPATQRISQHTHLVITIHNASNKAIPNLAVTICNVTCHFPAPPGEGTSAQPFAVNTPAQYVANPSRPIWIVDHPPGLCGYSCKGGGAGGDVTAYANTWALGHPLRAGGNATFDWAVTAVAPGRHVVAWQVAAGLNGKAKAVLSDGSVPAGQFTVTINHAPEQSYVNNNGQIVKGQGQ